MDPLTMLLLSGVIGLAFTGVAAIARYQKARLSGAPLVLMIVGLALWALGLASAIATR